MKKTLYLLQGATLFAGIMANAQIGIGTSSPNNSYIQHAENTDKGVLITWS